MYHELNSLLVKILRSICCMSFSGTLVSRGTIPKLAKIPIFCMVIWLFCLGKCLWIFCMMFGFSNKWLSRPARYFMRLYVGGAIQFIFGPGGVSFLWIFSRSYSLGGHEAWRIDLLLISSGVSDFLIGDYVLSLLLVGSIVNFMYTSSLSTLFVLLW